MRSFKALLGFAAAWCAVPHGAFAQAWVQPEGTLSLGGNYRFDFSNTFAEGAISATSGAMTSQAFFIDVDYVPVDRFAVRAVVPLMLLRFSGDSSRFPPHGDYDDGNFHFVPQDALVEARYQALEAPLALTPFVGVSAPMSDYEVQGYAAAGRGLKQAHLGLNLGRTLEPFLPKMYVHARYQFTLSESFDQTPETARFSQNRSSASMQLGYFFTYDWQFNLSASLNLQHDGVEVAKWDSYPQVVRDYHDPLLMEQALLVGPGTSYNLTDSLTLDALILVFIAGNNTRESRMAGVGLTWMTQP